MAGLYDDNVKKNSCSVLIKYSNEHSNTKLLVIGHPAVFLNVTKHVIPLPFALLTRLKKLYYLLLIIIIKGIYRAQDRPKATSGLDMIIVWLLMVRSMNCQ